MTSFKFVLLILLIVCISSAWSDSSDKNNMESEELDPVIRYQDPPATINGAPKFCPKGTKLFRGKCRRIHNRIHNINETIINQASK